MLSPVSRRGAVRNVDKSLEIFVPILRKLQKERNEEASSAYADLTFGNPHDGPIPEYAAILRDEAARGAMEGCSPSLFQYQLKFDEERSAILDALRRRRGPAYSSLSADDIFVTNGAFGGLVMAIKTFSDTGDTIVVTTPDYFGYGPTIDGLECSVAHAPLDADADFDLDVAAIRNTLLRNAPRARILLLTNPNNPTGRMYSRERLEDLGRMLEEVNVARAEEYGDSRPIVVVSDEVYHRIIFPSTGQLFVSPAEIYPHTICIYSYAKTCMSPSERMGWLTLGLLWPEEAGCRSKAQAALSRARFSSGWLVPSGTNSRCIPRLEEGEGVRVDLSMLQRRRDALVRALRVDAGPGVFPRVVVPESGFYMLVQVPPRFFPGRDVAFTRMLGERYRVVVLCMSTLANLPGWIRLSLTASDEMVDVAVGGIKKFGEDYRRGDPELDRWIHGDEVNKLNTEG